MKTYKISQAIALVAAYGLTDTLLVGDYHETDRLITIHQNWTSSGDELAEFRLARGAYKGQWIGNVRRAKAAV